MWGSPKAYGVADNSSIGVTRETSYTSGLLIPVTHGLSRSLQSSLLQSHLPQPQNPPKTHVRCELWESTIILRPRDIQSDVLGNLEPCMNTLTSHPSDEKSFHYEIVARRGTFELRVGKFSTGGPEYPKGPSTCRRQTPFNPAVFGAKHPFPLVLVMHLWYPATPVLNPCHPRERRIDPTKRLIFLASLHSPSVQESWISSSAFPQRAWEDGA